MSALKRCFVGRCFFLVIFILLVSLFLARYFITGYGVGSDGEGYYMYLPSILLDHDLNFTNQIYNAPWADARSSFIDEGNREFYSKNLSREELIFIARGVARGGDTHTNYWPIGMAVLLSPFFIFSQLIVTVGSSLSIPFKTNGYSSANQIITLSGSILYSVIGLYVSAKLSEFYTRDKFASRLSAALILLGTFILQYVSSEPSMSHGVSFFISSLFIYICISKLNSDNPKLFFVGGLIGGIMISVRQQNIVLLILPIILFLNRIRGPDWKLIRKLGLSCLGLAAGLLPLLISSYIMYGNPFFSPQNQFISLQQINLAREMHALLAVNPIIMLALCGLLLKSRLRAEKQVFAAVMITIAAAVALNAMITLTGDSFGPRRYDNVLPFFVLGLSIFIYHLRERRTSAIGWTLLALLVLMNLFYFVEYNLGIISRGYALVNPLNILKSFLFLIQGTVG